jgi:hypothetical protein
VLAAAVEFEGYCVWCKLLLFWCKLLLLLSLKATAKDYAESEGYCEGLLLRLCYCCVCVLFIEFTGAAIRGCCRDLF